MADENQNGDGGQSPIADSPDERLEEFEQLLGVPSSRYGDAVERALEHFRSAPVDALQHGWVALGPRNVGGAIRCLAQHPARQDVFFAGSSQGGLWKSEDNGYSWRPAAVETLTAPVGAIAIAPSRPNVVYVGTGEPAHGPGGTGLYKSEDGGNSFSRVVGNASTGDDGAADHYRRLVVDPMEARRFWAATEGGLWRFDPSLLGGGFTPERLLGGGENVTDVTLAPHPSNADRYRLLACVAGALPPAALTGGVGGGIFWTDFSRSSGKTDSWNRAQGVAAATLPPGATPLPTAGFGRIRLAFSGTKTRAHPPITTPIAYAIMEDLGVMGYPPGTPAITRHMRLQFPTFVYRSQDFGQTWFADAGSIAIQAPPLPPSTLDKDGQAGYSLVIAVDPHEPENVLAGYVNLHRSIDRGKTLITILDWQQYDFGDRGQHGDQHAIVFDRRDSRQIWVCNDGGISFTEDYAKPAKPPIPGATNALALWRKRSYGIGAAQFTAISTHPRFPFICGGGMQDNGTFISYGECAFARARRSRQMRWLGLSRRVPQGAALKAVVSSLNFTIDSVVFTIEYVEAGVRINKQFGQSDPAIALSPLQKLWIRTVRLD